MLKIAVDIAVYTQLNGALNIKSSDFGFKNERVMVGLEICLA